jgi:hypothetical protein
MAFRIDVQQSPNQTVFLLTGILDESANLSSIKFTKDMNVVMDVKDIMVISSMGVRNWVTFIKDSPTPRSFSIRNLQMQFVNLLNTVGNVLPAHVVIDSFYLPFVCPECVTGREVLLKRGVDFTLGSTDVKIPPTPQCPDCKVDMEVDVLVPTYFEFLKYFGKK